MSFNSRPSVTDDLHLHGLNRELVVSIHARAWRATPTLGGMFRTAWRFNSRPRVAGDTVEAAAGMRWEFQFTPARGGRQVRVRAAAPPARGGRQARKSARPARIVSIHARAWRATGPGSGNTMSCSWFQFTPARGGRHAHESWNVAVQVFQFTPARGGRQAMDERENRKVKFQFTPARGGRPRSRRRGARQGVVSIHARAWRATSPRYRVRGKTPCFNSRPRVAGDSGNRAVELDAGFQFTPARGGRLYDVLTETKGKVSIHARHARAWRATFRRARGIFCTKCFNSRPRVAGDLNVGRIVAHRIVFQFTPARGGRPLFAGANGRAEYVSIHARAWRATS